MSDDFLGSGQEQASGVLDPDRWRALWQRIGLEVAAPVWDELARRYGQKHRKYHNGRHVADCLRELDGCRHPAAADPLLELALWFHDAIYDAFSSHNEQASADWAASVMRDAGADPDAVDRVGRLILATRHQALPESPDEQLMVDIDLSILGAADERFDAFEQQIRQEYRWVPARLYRRKRAEVLGAFLERPAVYATAEFRDRLEARARENLRRALSRL